MTMIQLICLQLLLIVVSHQILAIPTINEDLSEAMMNNNRDMIQTQDHMFNSFEKILYDLYNQDNIQRAYDKVSKRRAQAKANLAGLWGVPTRFA